MKAFFQARETKEEHREKLLEWYKVRDTLLGENNLEQNVIKALELAAVSEHTDARWLKTTFAQRSVDTVESARKVFFEQGDDARAVCFSEVLIGDLTNINRLRRPAELGYAFAQAAMSWETNGDEKFSWAQSRTTRRA